MKTGNGSILLSGQTNMAAARVSGAIFLANIVNYSIQIAFADFGDPIHGVFSLEVSNDDGQATPGTTPAIQQDKVVLWTTIANSSQSVSDNGDIMWDIQNSGYRWARVRWTPDGGGSGGTWSSARFMTKGA